MRSWAYASLGLGCLVALLACGSRTGLLVPEGEINQEPDGDDSTEPDASRPDASTRDAGRIEDALPPLDVSAPREGGNPSCAEAGATLVYVVSEDYQLLSFNPDTNAFLTIGNINCPVAIEGEGQPPTPFSMAVDHTGIAYVVYSDGELFRVSTATAVCRSTGFVSGQLGFPPKFGMGYSQNSQGTAESLYVASTSADDAAASRLATIQTTNFRLSIVGALQPQILNAELTGTGTGDLFAFYATDGTTPCDNTVSGSCPDSAIGQIDKTTAQVTNQVVFRGVPQGSAWAFAFWGGDFYLFTAPSTTTGTIVYRYRPSDGTLTQVAKRPDDIVGAGVSTCAPAD
jgi:hypothetical protein